MIISEDRNAVDCAQIVAQQLPHEGRVHLPNQFQIALNIVCTPSIVSHVALIRRESNECHVIVDLNFSLPTSARFELLSLRKDH